MGAVQPGAVVSYEHTWVHSSPYAPLPPFAVVGGHDCDRTPIYVGRSFHEGENLPAKVVPSKRCAYICWGGQEHQKTHYEILVGQMYAWAGSCGGSVPTNAVRTGTTRTGEPLYVGRGYHAGSLSVGKIHASHGCLYIPFGGQEVRLNTYEVLIYQQRDVWIPAAPTYTPPGAVVAGHDSDRTPIYVGRALHSGEWLPAKVVPSKANAYVCFGGYEHPKTEVEVLTGYGYEWVRVPHHSIPPNAVSTGRGNNGEPLYVGRGHYQGSLTPGLVSLTQRCLYIPYAHKWVHSSAYSTIPPNAVVAGNDEDGAIIYVGRAKHDGDMLVCKVVPSKQIGFVSYHGEAIPKDAFEILCGPNLSWVKCYDHVIPANAVLCGRTSLEQPVYIGRGYYEGYLIPGKISSVHRSLFIPFRGAERRLESYEILVEDRVLTAGWSVPSDEPEKCPLTPPPPPPPPSQSFVSEKGSPYPANNSAPYPYPYPLDDQPPMYTPTVMPQPIVAATPQPTVIVPADTYQPHAATYNPPTFTSASTYEPLPSYTPTAAFNPNDIWLNTPSTYMPPNVVIAGHDIDLSPLLICRAYHEGLLTPGKLAPNRGCAYIPHAGYEITKTTFDVLIGNERYHWVPGHNGGIAPGAVEAGRSISGEPLYIGRAHYCGSLTPGKIQRSHGCLYIPFGGSERRITDYEVLVRKDFYYRNQAYKMAY